MSSNSSRKRKVENENREFHKSLTYDYFFTYIKTSAVCLICSQITICYQSDIISGYRGCEKLYVFKKYNIRRHDESKDSSKFDNLQGQLRKDMVDHLQETTKLI